MGDDGFGIAAVERLRVGWILPDTVQLVDAGTWGMNLLPLVEQARQLLLLDAIDRGGPAGELVVLERDAIPRFLGLKLSPHQVDLREVLALAELRGTLPEQVIAMGLQPKRVEMVPGLSPEIESRMDQFLARVLERLAQWGHHGVTSGSLTSA
jgi:hydrogenase maturation protease